jgi:hypothetical protein
MSSPADAVAPAVTVTVAAIAGYVSVPAAEVAADCPLKHRVSQGGGIRYGINCGVRYGTNCGVIASTPQFIPYLIPPTAEVRAQLQRVKTDEDEGGLTL